MQTQSAPKQLKILSWKFQSSPKEFSLAQTPGACEKKTRRRHQSSLSYILFLRHREERKPGEHDRTLNPEARKTRHALYQVCLENQRSSSPKGSKRHMFLLGLDTENPEGGSKAFFRAAWGGGSQTRTGVPPASHDHLIFMCRFQGKTQRDRICASQQRSKKSKA